MAFVPRPIVRSAGYHVVSRNDSPVSIAALYGQPETSYRDLVAVNHHKPMRFAGMPRGSSATFASLHEGERLRLPWFWFAGKNASRAAMLSDGMVGDTKADAFDVAIHDMLAKHFNTKPDQADAMSNAISLWWKQDHPGAAYKAGGPLPSDIKPYYQNALAWWTAYGMKMNPDVASSVPWSEVPWHAWGKAIAQGLQPKQIDWADVNDYLEKNAPIGAGAPQDFPSFSQAINWGGNIHGTSTPWASASFDVLPMIRFDLLPLDKIDFSGIPQNKSKAATDWLLSRLVQVLGQEDQEAKPKPGGGGIQFDPDILKHLPKPTDTQPCNPGQVYVGGKCYVAPAASGACPEGFDPGQMGGKAVCLPKNAQPSGGTGQPAESSNVGTIVVVGGVAIAVIALYLANRK